ncbi:MAG: hypothetical protein RR322_01795 [Oscillospiraceae bacterium]
MQAFWKEKEIVVDIYGTTNDKNGYPMFLVRYKNQWIWRSAKHFETFGQGE